jgi:uncharacterized protein (TIGR02611 family)
MAAPEDSKLRKLQQDAIEAEYATGRREETEAKAKAHVMLRMVRVVAGVVVLVIGVVLLAAPGPGLLVIALGLGLLAQDVPFAARLLERVRARLPQDEDGKLPTSTIVSMVAVCLVTVSASLWWTFLRPD